MNINTLERIARMAFKGEKVDTSVVLTPAEHKSLKSLSWQIASNVNAEKSNGTLALVLPNRFWQ